ncbi:MAG: 3-oxoacid CoA-transferase subunit A [Pseudomonadota bacterium]
MHKQVHSVSEATACINDGSTVMIGGFGGSGAPIELIHSLVDRFRNTGSPKDLTIINNNAGNGHVGIAAMIAAGMVKKIICSFPRSSNADVFNAAYLANQIELELVPQGTLAERIRAGGAGIPAFFTKTGYGTELADGKPTARFDGKMYVQERWLKADFALVKAQTADRFGNLTYRFAARNFAPVMCMAASRTIAQAKDVLTDGSIHPEHIITPSIFVDTIVEVAAPEQEEVLVRGERVY